MHILGTLFSQYLDKEEKSRYKIDNINIHKGIQSSNPIIYNSFTWIINVLSEIIRKIWSKRQ